MQGGGEWQAKIKRAGGDFIGLPPTSPNTKGHKQAYLASFLTEMGERGQRVALS